VNGCFLVDPTSRWQGQEGQLRVDSGGLIAVGRMAALRRKPGVQGGRGELPSRVQAV
jgi:hypothetical protein